MHGPRLPPDADADHRDRRAQQHAVYAHAEHDEEQYGHNEVHQHLGHRLGAQAVEQRRGLDDHNVRLAHTVEVKVQNDDGENRFVQQPVAAAGKHHYEPLHARGDTRRQHRKQAEVCKHKLAVDAVLVSGVVLHHQIAYAAVNGAKHIVNQHVDGAYHHRIVGIHAQLCDAHPGNHQVVRARHQRGAHLLIDKRDHAALHQRLVFLREPAAPVLLEEVIFPVAIARNEHIGEQHAYKGDEQITDIAAPHQHHNDLQAVLQQAKQILVQAVDVVILIGADEGPLVGKEVAEHRIAQKKQIN